MYVDFFLLFLFFDNKQKQPQKQQQQKTTKQPKNQHKTISVLSNILWFFFPETVPRRNRFHMLSFA